jgi:SSS family solute:Na+ symporter
MDVHKRYINKNIPDRGLLKVAKWTVLLISVIAYVLILLIPQNIFDLGIVALGGTTHLIVPVVGALFWKRSTAQGRFQELSSVRSFSSLVLLWPHGIPA